MRRKVWIFRNFVSILLVSKGKGVRWKKRLGILTGLNENTFWRRSCHAGTLLARLFECLALLPCVSIFVRLSTCLLIVGNGGECRLPFYLLGLYFLTATLTIRRLLAVYINLFPGFKGTRKTTENTKKGGVTIVRSNFSILPLREMMLRIKTKDFKVHTSVYKTKMVRYKAF